MKPTPVQLRVLTGLANGGTIAATPTHGGYVICDSNSSDDESFVPRGTFNALRAAGWITPRYRSEMPTQYVRYVLSAAGERVERENRNA